MPSMAINPLKMFYATSPCLLSCCKVGRLYCRLVATSYVLCNKPIILPTVLLQSRKLCCRVVATSDVLCNKSMSTVLLQSRKTILQGGGLSSLKPLKMFYATSPCLLLCYKVGRLYCRLVVLVHSSHLRCFMQQAHVLL